MGCVLCNITGIKEFIQGPDPAKVNPFYCETPQQLEEFEESLAYDIAASHPEMRALINKYVKKSVKDKPKTDTKSMREMRKEICVWAEEHGLIIHSGGYDYAIEGFLMFNHCPCVPSRKHCPCPESIEEVEVTGHCRCRLFWKSYKIFKQEMIGE